MRSSLRCGAKTRSGKPCMSPAVSGKKRCSATFIDFTWVAHASFASMAAIPIQDDANVTRHGCCLI
ncbi:MAG: HGGxSTG domain-containing protein [Rhodoplanes sp.]